VLPIDEGTLASVDSRVAEFNRYGLEVVYFDNWDGKYDALDALLEEAMLRWQARKAPAAKDSELTKVGDGGEAASLTRKQSGQGQTVDIRWLEEINEITGPSLKKNEN
jgi:hypothetical protein